MLPGANISDHRFRRISFEIGRFILHRFKGRIHFASRVNLLLQQTGVEGSLIYAISAQLRDEIEANGSAVIKLDLAPGWSKQRLKDRLSLPRGSRTITGHLEKSVHIKGVKAGLLREFVPKQDFLDPDILASAIKELTIPLIAPRPLG